MFTLVQHSGCGYGGKPEFARSVEIRHLDKKQERVVRKVGGMIIPDHAMASELEEHVNYPPEVMGLYPRCRGVFSSREVDKLSIYVPTEFCRGPLTVREVMES